MKFFVEYQKEYDTFLLRNFVLHTNLKTPDQQTALLFAVVPTGLQQEASVVAQNSHLPVA